MPISSYLAVGVFLLLLVPWENWLDGAVSLGAVDAPMSWAHPFGTDNLGRDLLVRISLAIRQAVIPLWMMVLAAGVVGPLLAWVLLGLTEWGLSRIYVRSVFVGAILLASIPSGLAAFLLAGWMGAAGLAPILMALFVLFAVRGLLLTFDLYEGDRQLAYWEAHAASGGSLATRIWRYGFCGAWTSSLRDQLSLHMRAAVAIEAAISYLGFGIQEPLASFGNILASHLDSALRADISVLGWVALGLALAAVIPAILVAPGGGKGLLVDRNAL